jgi:hypothetical protein
MRRVALVGKGLRTRSYIEKIPDDVEIWTLASCYNVDEITRIDRMFEIHPRWMLEQPRYDPHIWEWLTGHPHTFDIYTQGYHPEIDRCVAYPLDMVLLDLFWSQDRGEVPNHYLTSTFDYMVALAIFEQVDEIQVIGFDMGTDTEYRYQREGASHVLGIATGREIEVWLPPESTLLRAKLYAWEAGQMVGRQRLERIFGDYKLKKQKAIGALNYWRGVVSEREERWKEAQSPETEAALREADSKLRQVQDEFFAVLGAWNALKHLIDEIDLQEPTEAEEQMFVVSAGAND